MARRYLYELLEHGITSAARDETAPDRPVTARRALTVTQAARAIRRVLEGQLVDLWVEGEISNYRPYPSGHWYFTLKDAQSQLPAVMFAGDNRRVRFKVEEGAQVLARGRVSFYESGGRAQLMVTALEPTGLGARTLALRQLAERLQAEGLFDATRKKVLPLLPRKLGVVTSLEGAALRDVLQVARRRMPRLPVVISPTRVQGEGAEQSIARALRQLDQSGLTDVIILGRGGGSVEDLEVFSSEVVVRAVAACATPVISAVGHEIDQALCDLAADLRAPTPSAAAELAVPILSELEKRLEVSRQRIRGLILGQLTTKRARLAALVSALTDPRALVRTRRQDLDLLWQRAERGMQRRLVLARTHLSRLRERQAPQHPGRRLATAGGRLEVLRLRQRAALDARLDLARAGLQQAAASLHALSPLAVLGRGYAICLHRGKPLREARAVEPGSQLEVRLARGRLQAQVQRITDDEEGF
ncbi:MAG: exodeoxyribonuclease VII large subunit [Pseudomonadota bacterium]